MKALILILTLLSCSHAFATKVAIYNDTGVWRPGKRHFRMFFRAYGIEADSIDAEEIQAGALEAGSYDALIMPGGKSWKYLRDLGSVGAEKIAAFVTNGGGYLGICAGSFYATSLRQGPRPDERGDTHATASYSYGIGLISGTAIDGANGALPGFESDFSDGMRTFVTPRGRRLKALMVEGPALSLSDSVMRNQNVHVLATFERSALPAIVSFEVGAGRVLVSGPHIEINESQFFLGIPYRDPESEWPFLFRAIEWISHQRQDLSL